MAPKTNWSGLHARGIFRGLRGPTTTLASLWCATALLAATTPLAPLVEMPLSPRSGPRGATLFRPMTPQETGVVTENNYADPKMWAEKYRELEVGAVGTGVAIGDFDGDGRPDIFVVSKTETCRLFRNLGDWKFEDVSERAGVLDRGEAASVWKQGATFVDVNNDGRLDLYVCRFAAPNLLYINQGDGTFRDEAAARGLAISDSSVMAAFYDYDRDGFLDLFLQTNLLHADEHPKGQPDYLFHNNGDGTFANVTTRAGLKGDTQGHSATWWDYDHDGWPDLYVANDFSPADNLYHNNRDGTFTDVIDRAVPHTPFSSMGSDLGDVNNDGLMDLLVADMAATTHEKDQRTMAATRALAGEPAEATAPQLLRNALYLGTATGRTLEAAFLTGLAATDWTWSVRFEDLDNDGRIDLHVTNGMHRESHNTDLLARMTLAPNPAAKVLIEKNSPVLAEANLAYRNAGELKFEEVGQAWGLNERGVSYGAALGDLDGDGDLDLVYTNYQKGVTLLRNDSDQGHRVVFALRGTASNRFGVGAVVRIETVAGVQVRQLVLARGVLSNSEPMLHFGTGENDRLQRVTVEWPSGQTQVFTDLAVDRRYTVTEPAASSSPASSAMSVAPQFDEVSGKIDLRLASREPPFDELAQQPLLPFRQNRRGPALAVADVNGDGRDDVVIGGTPLDPLRIRLAEGDGRFRPSEAGVTASEGPLSDGPVLLFDADGDGDNDLLVTKSGTNRPAGAAEYQPHLYLNDMRGTFRRAPEGMLPLVPVSVGAAAAADFDHDGKLDVFLGARVVPGDYPQSPRSSLWRNQGGRLEDVTDQVAPALREAGMVTAAVWSDVDQDGWVDLLLAVEWGPVRYFHNAQGRGFEERTTAAGFSAAGNGWWTSLASADFNGDGRPDYVAGNVGLNTPYRADLDQPTLLFAGDFKGDDTTQLVEAYFDGTKIVPRRARRTLGASIPAVLKKYPRNDMYARASLTDILGADKLAAATKFTATELRSGVFLSQPDGRYLFSPLPAVAQIAPLQGVVAGDFDGDGNADIFAVQNSFAPVPAIGRFDGGLSQLLRGDARGGFVPVPAGESGLSVAGDAKAVVTIDLDGDGRPDFLVSRNQGATLAFRNASRGAHRLLAVRLEGRAGNRRGIGAQVALRVAGHWTQVQEVFAGSGYFSQSSTTCSFARPSAADEQLTLRVRWPDGTSSEQTVEEKADSFVVVQP